MKNIHRKKIPHFQTGCFTAFSDWRWQLVEVLDLAKKFGFDGVEIWEKEPHKPYPFDENKIKKIRQMVKERGLSISMFGSYFSYDG